MKLDITLKQYELIFRIVSSVGEQFSHGAGKSCQFYNVTGAILLSQVLKIQARPMMGAAFFMVNDHRDVITYAGMEDGRFFSSPDAFHCWVETQNYYIDFTAPEFNVSEVQFKGSVPRKMFQKPKASIADSPECLDVPGDFYLESNNELTSYLLQRMYSIPASRDLANICLEWYIKSKKKILKDMEIMNDLGEIIHIRLKEGSLTSAW